MKRPTFGDYFVLTGAGLCVILSVLGSNALSAALWGIVFGGRLGELFWRLAEQKRRKAEGFF